MYFSLDFHLLLQCIRAVEHSSAAQSSLREDFDVMHAALLKAAVEVRPELFFAVSQMSHNAAST